MCKLYWCQFEFFSNFVITNMEIASSRSFVHGLLGNSHMVDGRLWATDGGRWMNAEIWMRTRDVCVWAMYAEVRCTLMDERCWI